MHSERGIVHPCASEIRCDFKCSIESVEEHTFFVSTMHRERNQSFLCGFVLVFDFFNFFFFWFGLVFGLVGFFLVKEQ